MLLAFLFQLALRSLLALLYLLQKFLNLLQELERFLWLRLGPGHDLIGFIIHLLEVGLEFVLNLGRSCRFSALDWYERLLRFAIWVPLWCRFHLEDLLLLAAQLPFSSLAVLLRLFFIGLVIDFLLAFLCERHCRWLISFVIFCLCAVISFVIGLPALWLLRLLLLLQEGKGVGLCVWIG